MESKKTTVPEQSVSDNSKPDEIAKTVNDGVPESNPTDHSLPPPSEDSSVITDEVLRHRIRSLMNEKSKPSKLQTISTNPLVSVVVGFVLTALVGGALTYYYGRQQQELAARRSFSDEINRTRVQKLGEVWEQLDEDEFVINDLLEESRLEAPNSDSEANNDKRIDGITKLIRRDQAMASKYRYWLGEDLFRKTSEYLDKNIEYTLKKLGSKRGADLSELVKTRDAAKQDVLQLRSLFLQGEPNPPRTEK
jgi:hypothetical protein